MAEIKDTLQEKNPWWVQGFKIDFKDRAIYRELNKFLRLPQIIALIGLRRVGKTTIMFKIIENSISCGHDAKKIIYFSFDEFKDINIRDVLKTYEQIADVDLRDGKYLLLLDEIQKLNNWENQLKSIYDSYKNIKIIISGSESLFIQKKSKETLAGRMFEFKVSTLSFAEFLNFKNVEFKPIGLHEKELLRQFDDFIVTQGFPELVSVADKSIIKKYVQEGIIDKVIFKDIPTLFKIKDISILESLLKLILENPGQLIELSDLSKDLKVSRQTLSNYLMYLEKSFLIKKLYNFSKSRRKVERKLKKYYPAFISTDLAFRDDDLSKSKVFEWAIINQSSAEFFWRDSYKNEVDMVLEKLTPVEIKYGKIDTHGVLAFMNKFNVENGLIVSLNREEKIKAGNKTISVIPAYKFLLA